MNWIINEKIRRPFTFSGCVFICSINMMMINVCLRLLFYAGASQKADWYQESLDWHYVSSGMNFVLLFLLEITLI